MSFSNPQEKGRPIKIKDEGLLLTSNVDSINFAGNGVAGEVVGTEITETVSGVPGTAVSGEVPSGTVDSSNVTFTIAHTPISGTFKLFLNGIRQKEADDFSRITTTITFIIAPETGSNILCDYNF